MIEDTPGGVLLSVRVIPRANRPGIDGTRGGALLVRLGAAPAEGAANEELVEVIARALDVPRRSVTIAAGARSRSKRVRVAGIDLAAAAARLPRAATE